MLKKLLKLKSLQIVLVLLLFAATLFAQTLSDSVTEATALWSLFVPLIGYVFTNLIKNADWKQRFFGDSKKVNIAVAVIVFILLVSGWIVSGRPTLSIPALFGVFQAIWMFFSLVKKDIANQNKLE